MASLLKDTTIHIRVRMLLGFKSFFDCDQNLPMHWNNAWKCKMLIWRRRNKLWYRYVNKINSVNEKIINSEEEKSSITMSIGKLDGGTTESHGETRRQRLHLQHRSGKTHKGRRAGAHGIPHYLINGGGFGFLEVFSRKSTGGVNRTRHTLTRNICAAQFDHGSHRTLNALGLAQVQD